MIRKILQWIFSEAWDDFIEEMKESDFLHKTLIERNLVAERYLKHLGYELMWNDPVHEIKEGEVPMPAESYGWRLVKSQKPKN